MQDQVTLVHRAVDATDTARARHAEGFKTEAARKEALYFVGRAYSAIRDLAREQGFDVYDLPFDLHQYRTAKHAALLGPALAAKVEQLAQLRGDIRAVALQPKVKTRTPEQIRKDLESKTCQICGRPIFAEAGVIAHHGYERPFEGYQTASCPGARKLPFEVDRSRLAREIAMLEDAIHTADRRVADIDAERVALVVGWETKEEDPQWRALPSKRRFLNRYVKVVRPVTRATFEAVEAEHRETNRYGTYHPLVSGGRGFEGLKAKTLAGTQAHRKQLQDTLVVQQGRYDGWRQTHRKGGAGEPVWVAL